MPGKPSQVEFRSIQGLRALGYIDMDIDIDTGVDIGIGIDIGWA